MRGHGETNSDRIHLHRTVLQFPIFLILYYFGEKLTSGKTMGEKTSQKITEMGLIVEFVENPRNSSQGMITGLLRSLEYI